MLPDKLVESSTAVPSTPVHSNKGRAVSDHFNLTLDRALGLLRQQDGSCEQSTILPADQTAINIVDNAAPDDLILDHTSAKPPSQNSLSSSQTEVETLATSNVVAAKPPQLEDTQVECQVRARIPYPGGHFYLHLYHTNEDDKEHLAIVFGDDIRSKTLEAVRGQETDMDRKIRGASTGALRNMIEKDIANRSTETSVNAKVGDCRFIGFEPDPVDSFTAQRVSLVDAPLVRIHSECFTGETVSSVRCDCGYQLAEGMRLIQQEERGVIVYLRQEGRGIGLLEKLKAYNLQDMGNDTVDANLLLNHPADARTYGAARGILADLGIAKMRLLTNNIDKIRQLRSNGRQQNGGYSSPDIVCHVPMYPRWWDSSSGSNEETVQLSYGRHLDLRGPVMAEADQYLRTKAQRMGHMINLEKLEL